MVEIRRLQRYLERVVAKPSILGFFQLHFGFEVEGFEKHSEDLEQRSVWQS